MRLSDHKGYVQALAKLETLEQDAITARAQAEAAQAALTATKERALTLPVTSASFDADLARRRSAHPAGARAGATEEACDAQRQVVERMEQEATAQLVARARDTHGKAISRMGMAIRELLAGMDDEATARNALRRSLEDPDVRDPVSLELDRGRDPPEARADDQDGQASHRGRVRAHGDRSGHRFSSWLFLCRALSTLARRRAPSPG
jgi:hypothetical protein